MYYGIAIVVSYFGHPECVQAFFDFIAQTILTLGPNERLLTRFVNRTLVQSEAYFVRQGCPELPKKEIWEIDMQQFPAWWQNNREHFLATLSKDSSGFYPFLKLHYNILNKLE